MALHSGPGAFTLKEGRQNLPQAPWDAPDVGPGVLELVEAARRDGASNLLLHDGHYIPRDPALWRPVKATWVGTVFNVTGPSVHRDVGWCHEIIASESALLSGEFKNLLGVRHFVSVVESHSGLDTDPFGNIAFKVYYSRGPSPFVVGMSNRRASAFCERSVTLLREYPPQVVGYLCLYELRILSIAELFCQSLEQPLGLHGQLLDI